MQWAIGRILSNTVVYSPKYNETTFRMLTNNDTFLVSVSGNVVEDIPMDSNNYYYVKGHCIYMLSLDLMKYSIDLYDPECFRIHEMSNPRNSLSELIDSFRHKKAV